MSSNKNNRKKRNKIAEDFIFVNDELKMKVTDLSFIKELMSIMKETLAIGVIIGSLLKKYFQF